MCVHACVCVCLCISLCVHVHVCVPPLSVCAPRSHIWDGTHMNARGKWVLLFYCMGPWEQIMKLGPGTSPMSHLTAPLGLSSCFSLSVLGYKHASRHSTLKFLFISLYFYFIRMGVLPEYMSMHHVCVVPTDARKGWQIPWDQNCRWLPATLQVLGLEPGSSGRTLNHPPSS